MENKFKVGDSIKFCDDLKPFKVMAVSERHLIATRSMCIKSDYSLLENLIYNWGYKSISQAYAMNKDYPIYTIVDFEDQIRGAAYCKYDVDWRDEKSCPKALKRIEDGSEFISISIKNRVELKIDYFKSFKKFRDRSNKKHKRPALISRDVKLRIN